MAVRTPTREEIGVAVVALNAVALARDERRDDSEGSKHFGAGLFTKIPEILAKKIAK